MAIKYVKRLAGPYVGVGQTTFTFSFLIYEASDVYVGTAMSEAERTSILEINTDYTVSMNADQQATPGGTITLKTPLVEGQIVVIGSDLDYEQFLQLTNYSRFPPELVNKALDRLCIQIQQIVEKIGRTLSVPATSSETPESMIERLLKAQNDAKAYADAAQTSAEVAKGVEDRLLGQEATLGDSLETLAEEKKEELVGVGDSQVARLQAITDETLVGYGVGGHQETWTLTQDVASDGSIVLPNSMTYIRGRNHLRINWNGLTLYPSENFEEVGTVDQPSTTFKTLFQMKAGDVLNAWTVPLGRGELGNVETDVANLTSAVAELSRKAAFHNAGETQQ